MTTRSHTWIQPSVSSDLTIRDIKCGYRMRVKWMNFNLSISFACKCKKTKRVIYSTINVPTHTPIEHTFAELCKVVDLLWVAFFDAQNWLFFNENHFDHQKDEVVDEMLRLSSMVATVAAFWFQHIYENKQIKNTIQDEDFLRMKLCEAEAIYEKAVEPIGIFTPQISYSGDW